MATITRLSVGQSEVGDGPELAHVDVLLGPRGSSAEGAFTHCLTAQQRGAPAALAVLSPNMMCKPATALYAKIALASEGHTAHFFGPAQRGVARAIADSVAVGTLPADEANDVFLCVGVFLHWKARDTEKIEEFNYRATREAIARAVCGLPTLDEMLAHHEQA